MKKLRSLGALFGLGSVIVGTAGCATIFNGSSQQVAVRSNLEGVKLFANEAYIGKNSAVTTFSKKQNYMLRASKEGCSDVTVPAPKSFDAITLLGVLIDFGVVSVLLVDGAGTGAWQKFDQTSFVLDPVCGKD